VSGGLHHLKGGSGMGGARDKQTQTNKEFV